MTEAPAHALAAPVVVYSREGCHLCETAEALVDRVTREHGVAWLRVDVDSDPDLLGRFSDQVPVTFVAGRQHDFWRVDADRLARALTAAGLVNR